MKKFLFSASLLFVSLVVIVSCSKTKDVAPEAISQDVLQKIAALGFSNKDVSKIEQGYLVEGDIILTENDLKGHENPMLIRIANEEQYRTTNLVTGLPRTITVRVSTTLPSSYVTATDAMISRYNALNLRVHFSRVTSGGNIVITAAPSGAGYLGSSGFPSGGNPYSQVLLNRSYLDTWNSNTVVSIIAHEVGHCIGFRHTDYMSREYSCGGGHVNEGASTVGAILIPGTPSGPDAGSWMLACIGNGVNRPFNTNDKTALNYVY